jgi:hypothetical protein
MDEYPKKGRQSEQKLCSRRKLAAREPFPWLVAPNKKINQLKSAGLYLKIFG